MKRWLLFVCLVSAVCLALPSVAGATKSANPTLILEPDCYTDPDYGQVYGVSISGTGFPPNTTVSFAATSGRLHDMLGNSGSNANTDEFGNFGWGGVGLFEPLGFTTGVAYDDQNHDNTLEPGELIYTTTRIDNPCGPPTLTSSQQCKDDGYTKLAFKTQGECVAYVERGPGPG
jgi:hypothetical protein